MVLDLMDEIDGANFFDQIDDLIEFPSDDNCGIGGNTVGSCDLKDSPSIWSHPFPEPDPLFLGDVPFDISTELSVPYEDIVQLEWLSTFVEDSFSGWGLTIGKYSPCMKNNGPSHNHFQSSSPVSVLESSTSSISSCSSEKAVAFIPNLARNKKLRPTTFSTRPNIQAFKNPHSPVFDPKSENFTESALGPTQPEQKMKKRKIRGGLPTEWDKSLARKCTHCEITKTPQWRAGPMGPKTLCNACGVRYKSGRLFPEYRPAASPAFVPTLHSNSNKKVLEMRCKGGPVAMDAVSRASKPGLSRSPG